MSYFVIGINHKSAPVTIREKLAVSDSNYQSFLLGLKEKAAVSELVVLSTCNRTEWIAYLEQAEQKKLLVSEFLGQLNGVEKPEEYCYQKHDFEVVEHLFSVTSSLDSQVTGENQIINQVKDAYHKANELGATGTNLNQLFHTSLSVSKKVRSDTDISKGNVSIGSVGAMLAKRIFGSLKDKTVLLIGAGEMGQLVVDYLKNEDVGQVSIANRTFQKAMDLQEKGLGVAVDFESLPEHLQSVDVVISSISGELQALSPENMKSVMKQRQNETLFLIDLGLPRNIPQTTGKLDNVFLYNIDDLQAISEQNKAARSDSLKEAQKIVSESAQSFYEAKKSHVLPAIASLGQKFEEIRQQELSKTLSKFPDLTSEQRSAIDKMTQSIVNKIKHDPVLSLKKDGHEKSTVSFFKKLFRLDDEE